MKTAGRVPKRNHIARVQRLASERAEAQARRVAWQRLLHARSDYIDWQKFYLWVGSVLEIESGVPEWLIKILNHVVHDLSRAKGKCRRKLFDKIKMFCPKYSSV